MLNTDSVQTPESCNSITSDDELRFRQFCLPQDARLLAVIIGLGIVFHLLLFKADDLFTRGTPAWHWLLWFRIGLIGLSVWTLVVIWRINDPRRFDRWSFLWALSCALASPLTTLSRPATYTGHVLAELLVILALYAIQPGRSLNRVVPPLLLSAGSLFLFFFTKSAMGYVMSLLMVVSYVGGNTIGWLVSANWHRSRRQSFFTNELLEKLYRQAEAGRLAAEASERTWERIIDTSPNMLFVVDIQHRIVRVNQAFLDRLGLSRDDALGQRCCDLLCRAIEPPEFCLLHAIVQDGQAKVIEARFPPLGIECRIMAAPLFDQFGNYEATVFILQDISQQKESERDLRATREQYRSLVQNSYGTIYTITPEGVITYVSPSFTRLLGHAPEVLVGKHFRSIVHPDDLPACESFQQEMLTYGKSERDGLEYRVFHKDGTVRWHISKFTPCRDATGKVQLYVGNSLDISELKQYQFELSEAREAAERASNTKSEFLAMISHEIRTPLNAIVGFSGLARQTTDPEVLQEYVDILDKSSHHLMDLVNDILDMSRAEAGQLHLENTVFNLTETLEQVGRQFATDAAMKGLDFQVHQAEHLPQWVQGDPIRFRQILVNLLSNAIKFTEKGQVVLAVDLMEASNPSGDQLMRLAVRDTGIGLEESDVALLFQPFQQISPGSTRKYGGSGLGLAIVRRLVELMQGRITVASQVGQGSCFTVELPFAPAAPSQQQELVPPAVGQLHILVVEDNLFNRILLRDTLRSWGHQVTEADGAAMAIELFGKHRFDGVVLDIWMPDMDGIELTQRLRHLEGLSQRELTPIIAYTADTDMATRERCLAAGVQAVLCKPLDHRLLARTLATSCHQATPLPETVHPEPHPSTVLTSSICADIGCDGERLQIYSQLLHKDLFEELKRLDQAIQENDRNLCIAAAHSLKGLCGYFRDGRPSELARKLHHLAPTAPFAELQDKAEQLRAVCPMAAGFEACMEES